MTITNTLGKEQVQQFVSDVITMCNQNTGLMKCEPNTVLMGALHGTVLKLNWQSGEYWLVPYEDRKQGVTKAQFQIGKAGMTQLCHRSGVYKKLRSVAIKEGEIVKIDPIMGEYEFKALDNRDNLPTIGYYAFFELTNGGRNEAYWTKEKVIAHATEYSQAYKSRSGNSPWLKHFDTMAENVVLYHLLKRYGVKSRDFAVASRTNQSVIYDPQGTEVEYIDNPNSKGVKIIEKGAVKTEPLPSDVIDVSYEKLKKAVETHGSDSQKKKFFAKNDKSEGSKREYFENLPYTPSPEELSDTRDFEE
jgi:recombination protein RecT